MINLCVIYGGASPEHEVSVTSGLSVVKNINKQKYNVRQIYISKQGEWYEQKRYIEPGKIGENNIEKGLIKIENPLQYIKTFDVVFPVLHGKNGEDGTIQGLLEIAGVKYVGCKILASSLGMDKIYAKIIFDKAGIPQAKSIYIKKYEGNYIYIDNEFNETVYNLREAIERIRQTLKFPMFIKPSNSGSSVGINKAHNIEELIEHIEIAGKYDNKILIEESINGRELECAVLGNEEVQASSIGEIIPDDEFYSYKAKYNNSQTKTVIDPDIPEKIKEAIKKYSIKAFKAIDGKGLARVDFFWNEKDNIIYINEINTLPGFTQISMYSKLWEKSGKNYPELLEKLIQLAG